MAQSQPDRLKARYIAMQVPAIVLVPLLAAHVKECVGVAWARHETIGSYMGAALGWLESGGEQGAGGLSPVRDLSALHI